MSTRYKVLPCLAWSAGKHGVIDRQAGRADEWIAEFSGFEEALKLCTLLNKMQAVADAAENMLHRNRSPNLDEALAALKPKTTEQLLAERLEAADNLATTSAYCGDAVRHDAAITYEAAKAAHEASLL